ncbi:MAG: (2Fe-2S) ferredoxin domain-containing protein [Deltaproteobacteria bacterium]|nr:(2Fe-2S) ferredoxin domain-containing protein [Deltaproteobacteria bacterium]
MSQPVGYEKHLFVCMNERRPGHPRGCCAEKGSAEVRARFKALIAQHGLQGRVRANEAGCLDTCEQGVSVVVYPEAVWYGAVTVDDVDRIFHEHILGGRVVEEKRMREQGADES